jgi:O-antigen/teichoic acid export membrane protein
MSQFIKKIINSKFIKRSKIIFFGTILSQVITFGTSFIITTYYDPEHLGLLGTIGALISIVAGTLCFRFEVAIIQADNENAVEVFVKSTILGGTACLVFCLLCFLLPWEFAQKIRTFFVPFLLWCWAYCLFFNSKQLPFKFNNIEMASYGGIFRSGFTLIFQFLGGIINPSFETLLTGRISGDYVGTIVHVKKYISQFKFQHFKTNWPNFIKKHSDFIIYMAPHHLCLALSNNILIFFIERWHGLMIVGFYTLAQRLVMAPIEIIGSTISNVTIQRFGELKENLNEIRVFYFKVIIFSFFVSSISGFFIWLCFDFIIPLLGPKWSDSIIMIKALIPFFISYLFSMPTTYFLRFINRSRLQLILELIELVFKVLLLSLVDWTSSFAMVLIYGLASCFFSFIRTGIVYFLITKNS